MDGWVRLAQSRELSGVPVTPVGLGFKMFCGPQRDSCATLKCRLGSLFSFKRI